MRRYLLPALLALCIVFLPSIASAESNAGIFAPVISDVCTCPGTAPGFGCILDTIQNLLNLGVSLSAMLAVLIIAYAGTLLIFNPTKPEYRTQAKGMLANVAIGMVIVLASWLIVDFVMKIVYNPGAVFSGNVIGPWNDILGGGEACIVAQQLDTIFDGNLVTTPTTDVAASGGVLTNSGKGACNAITVAQSAAAGGARMSTQEANILACVAGPESQCGAVLQNYNWNGAKSYPPSTAYGPFQITLKGNSGCFENAACYQAAGVSGSLNCDAAFDSKGYAIPGARLEQCKRAAANLTCSSVAADCVYRKQGASAWTADKSSSKQQACISGNGG
ncbi:MAG: pilin [Patescibacteria group bacterium]